LLLYCFAKKIGMHFALALLDVGKPPTGAAVPLGVEIIPEAKIEVGDDVLEFVPGFGGGGV